jgi:Ca-activated chloride channel family protein
VSPTVVAAVIAGVVLLGLLLGALVVIRSRRKDTRP